MECNRRAGIARRATSCYHSPDFSVQPRIIMNQFSRFVALIPALLSLPFAADAQGLSDLDLRLTEADYAPAVRIEEHENRVVQEYRVNNNLYMVKITPTIGAPYFLVDEDGSGDMAWHRGDGQIETRVPQWTLATW